MRDERFAPRRWLPVVGVAAYLVGAGVQFAVPALAPWDGVLIGGGIAVLLVAYPEGRVRHAWAAAVALVAIGLVAALPFAPMLLATPWWNPTLLALFVVLIVGALLRYGRSLDTGERERARWAVLGVLLSFGGMGMLLWISASLHLPGIGSLGVAGNLAAEAFVLVFPACLIVGLAAPRLLPVDTALWWLLALGTTASALAGIAAAVAAWGAGWSTVAVAVLVVPALSGASWLATRIVYRGRLSPRAAGEQFLRQLETSGRAEATPAVLVAAASGSLRAAGAAFDGPGLDSVTIGRVHGDTEELIPVVLRGAQLGILRLAPRPGETALTGRDRAVAAELARRAAPALHDAAMVAELQHARERLIRAREEERRHLRQELHDDLAPALAGLALSADGLVRSLPGGSAHQAAAALLVDAKDAAVRARELAYGLRPAVLDDRGLFAAIRDRVGADPRIEITATALPDTLPAAVGLAALRIVQEAVANATRHADATRIVVHLHKGGDALHVRVEDDGRGMAPTPRSGIGLDSIRQRADELGGQARVDSTSPLGGVLVTATLPLGTP